MDPNIRELVEHRETGYHWRVKLISGPMNDRIELELGGHTLDGDSAHTELIDGVNRIRKLTGSTAQDPEEGT